MGAKMFYYFGGPYSGAGVRGWMMSDIMFGISLPELPMLNDASLQKKKNNCHI